MEPNRKDVSPEHCGIKMTDGEYAQIVAWCRGQEKISAGAIQRKFYVGFTVAESAVEQMKRDGLLEPSITKSTWIVKKPDSAVAAD